MPLSRARLEQSRHGAFFISIAIGAVFWYPIYMSQFSDFAKQHIDITKQTFGIDLGFDEESIKKQDELIQQGWKGALPENLQGPLTLFGCYLGEAIIHNLGGTWIEHEGNWMVEISGKDGTKMKANVFRKVENRFRNGDEDSIYYFYQMLKKTLNNELGI